MHCGAMDPDCMQWSPCSEAQGIPIECSGLYAACSMAQNIPIECSGFHAASLNADDSLHFGAMDPDGMHWSPFSEAQCIPLNAVDFMQHGPKHPD